MKLSCLKIDAGVWIQDKNGAVCFHDLVFRLGIMLEFRADGFKSVQGKISAAMLVSSTRSFSEAMA